MLLRHFDVLRNLISQEGSQSDHAGIISEIASVIKKFTQPVISDEEVSLEGKSNSGLVSGTLVSIFLLLGNSNLSCYLCINYIRKNADGHLE